MKINRANRIKGRLHKLSNLEEDSVSVVDYPVYHGSSEVIKEFDPAFQRELGFHFGKDRHQAEHRSENKSEVKNVGSYRLNIKNPLELDDVFKWDLRAVLSEMVRKGYIDSSQEKEAYNRVMTASRKEATETGGRLSNATIKHLTAELEALGFDGIKYENRGEGGGTAWIAFRPEQIQYIED